MLMWNSTIQIANTFITVGSNPLSLPVWRSIGLGLTMMGELSPRFISAVKLDHHGQFELRSDGNDGGSIVGLSQPGTSSDIVFKNYAKNYNYDKKYYTQIATHYMISNFLRVIHRMCIFLTCNI